ncbi:hypothetical protein EO244_16675 [Ancylomarina salipaludis]|uniref:Uncharacterized protein n=1 Tax=Ancylomarina salipaludis TaxID=2501299 RepID=A0A4Q1JIN8_9BACT|nr:hypothetical protein [Ancylomarina salipaludis]RXQ87176.1 hypothetical protein EO244_16675 [Ancylomarina salipaludis]
MKTIIISLIVLALSSISAYSQKCEISKDPFTNEQIVTFNFNKRTILYELKNDTVRFEMKFRYKGEKNVLMAKGASLLYKLENEKSIKLKSVNDSYPNSYVYANQVGTAYSLVFNVPREDLEEIANSIITVMRFPDTNGGYVDLVSKGSGKRTFKIIKKGAQCMLDNL